jgi:hypothetical protein
VGTIEAPDCWTESRLTEANPVEESLDGELKRTSLSPIVRIVGWAFGAPPFAWNQELVD